MSEYEDFVVERVMAGDSIIGLYPATEEGKLRSFEEWRRAKGEGIASTGAGAVEDKEVEDG